eukprot:TRINITY_DN93737_c0_g1_i1.p1 TRINITY_DN93737_c0_g1~~TRINITY_DN93737_c0_g1_i1.p1  ORF type:complete len:493 (-),score=87.09 TRINITY_DN93737_c0_g1_i1:1532-3010(-)
MSKQGASPVPAGRTRMTPSPGPGANNYFIVQCFISYSEQPQTPLILRIDTNASVLDVLHQALNKYNEVLRHSEYDPTTLARYSPPSSNPNDYILRVAKGDGTPDRAAPGLDPSGVMREQGLLFPYMLVLTLDPQKDINSMDLTDEYKTTLMRRPSVERAAQDNRQEQILMNQIGASRNGRSPSLCSDDIPPPPPEVTGGTALEQSQRYREGVMRKAVEENILAKDEIERRRSENLARIERERLERDRLHFESCEKRELERRRRVSEEKRAEEQRQLQIMEENHKLEMSRKMDQYMREQKQREMLQAQKKELEREERERAKRAEALNRERQLKQKEKEEHEEQTRREKRMLREMGKDKRMAETLDHIIGKLDNEVETDNHLRMQMLERERIEREAYEQELFEREYIAKVERQRKLQKEAQNLRQMEVEARKEQHRLALEQAKREEEARLQAIEEEKKLIWKAKHRQETEKKKRMKEMAVLQRDEEEILGIAAP